jgi:hypothetical protein
VLVVTIGFEVPLNKQIQSWTPTYSVRLAAYTRRLARAAYSADHLFSFRPYLRPNCIDGLGRLAAAVYSLQPLAGGKAD